MHHLRAALHAAVDLVLDAIEKDREDSSESKNLLENRAPAPLAKAPRASRRGSGLRTFVPTAPITDLDRERAREIMRRKGI